MRAVELRATHDAVLQRHVTLARAARHRPEHHALVKVHAHVEGMHQLHVEFRGQSVSHVLLQLRRQCPAADEVGGALGDHEHRAIGIAARHRGHDGGVGDAQAVDAAHAQLLHRPRAPARPPSSRCRPDAASRRRWRGCRRRARHRSDVRAGRDFALDQVRLRRACRRCGAPRAVRAAASTRSSGSARQLNSMRGFARRIRRAQRHAAARFRMQQHGVRR